ncbi:hypothetical protein [Kibdelosporangium persicum]|uniref:hypothetical protein n=1 Tax=Kibdelosporangium persicum TaxID=2698649 RepID=UPI001567BE91|nr:hypothetical protein [Kibdelosporangium persicum]
MDRDSRGVLWIRAASRPGEGRPEFGEVHSLRQRRAMRRLLCQVCGGPADQTAAGTLWLLPDFREDWPGWPNAMANAEPPVCPRCVEVSVRLCPKLRRGAAVIRARECPLVGVRGTLFVRGDDGPVRAANDVFAFGHPRIGWVQAFSLVRQLGDCTLIPPSELAGCAP